LIPVGAAVLFVL
jgi:drug/metabolite transporter (DMT)-like permease